MEINERLEEFKANGFTVFPGLFDEALMARWRGKFDDLATDVVNTMNRPKWWFGNMLEHSPGLMLGAVTNQTLLDFAEAVMGPFVQLDNLTLSAFPAMSPEEAGDKVSGWHRDRWGQVPRSDAYERPHAVNAISYLQDLTDKVGPLRVIPASHRKSITMTDEERFRPYPGEKIIYLKAGDVVFIHNNLIHSGTPNVSGKLRYFFSIYYNLTWLKPTDNHHGPNVQQLLKAARARDDYRVMRLLGEDIHLAERANSGFFIADEARWEDWILADKAALKVRTED